MPPTRKSSPQAISANEGMTMHAAASPVAQSDGWWIGDGRSSRPNSAEISASTTTTATKTTASSTTTRPNRRRGWAAA